jgi:hypothetical protein
MGRRTSIHIDQDTDRRLAEFESRVGYTINRSQLFQQAIEEILSREESDEYRDTFTREQFDPIYTLPECRQMGRLFYAEGLVRQIQATLRELNIDEWDTRTIRDNLKSVQHMIDLIRKKGQARLAAWMIDEEENNAS